MPENAIRVKPTRVTILGFIEKVSRGFIQTATMCKRHPTHSRAEEKTNPEGQSSPWPLAFAFRLGTFAFSLVGALMMGCAEGRAASAQSALQAMTIGDGFQVELVISEPEIRQPVSLSFDARGRLWVIQYLQYPTPAGLSPVSVDNYLRTRYDRRPEPPPRGPRGADRITICEQLNGKPKTRDFVAGLNLCSGMAIGHGGVFVMQPPYLLFYADRDCNDVPDGEPEVLLTGFGMEDAHAFANSLTWGPDGWLYGAQGSTVTANVRGIEFQQGIWRFHPRTKEFELFAEGGGNTWGLDFDARGEILAGTNFDEKMLHQVQGAYYLKNFGKHGALHNPHAYGYFGHVPYSGYRGPHISIGGIVYRGAAFPDSFNGAYIFGNTLDHAVYWARLEPRGSSFSASFGGTLLKTADESFRPVDCELGPDGAVYVADWCDKRATHLDPLDTWDRSNGRVYRIRSRQGQPRFPKLARDEAGGFDLRKLSSEQLLELLAEPNVWFVRQARLILSERRDGNVAARLRQLLHTSPSASLQLEALWALYVSGAFDQALAADLLKHPNENIRAWTVRFLGDARTVSSEIGQALVKMAEAETSAVVRSQLACSAKRFATEPGLSIVERMVRRDADAADAHIPLLLWWAIEYQAIAEPARLIRTFTSADMCRQPLVDQFILERLARRYAAEPGKTGLDACAQLLERAPSDAAIARFLQGIDQGLSGRATGPGPQSTALSAWFKEAWKTRSNDLALIRLGLRLRQDVAGDACAKLLGEPATPSNVRESLINALSETESDEALPILWGVLERSGPESVREAALRGLQRFPQTHAAEKLLELYPRLPSRLQERGRDALCSRASWALLLLKAIDLGKLDPANVSLEQIRQMRALNDEGLNERIEKRWGRVEARRPEEKQNTINTLKLVLKPSGAAGRDARGDPAAGKKIFAASCALCHKLFDEGNAVGPDLTGADRSNIDSLLEQIVNPSAQVRPEYVAFEARLNDEQLINGLMVESNASTVTLVDRNNQRHVIRREKIVELNESKVSLMPEGLLEALPPQSVMDLFAYLMKR